MNESSIKKPEALNANEINKFVENFLKNGTYSEYLKDKNNSYLAVTRCDFEEYYKKRCVDSESNLNRCNEALKLLQNANNFFSKLEKEREHHRDLIRQFLAENSEDIKKQ